MSALRIFVDLAMSPDELEMLRSETVGHELVFPSTPASSVLDQPAPDPQFTTVDIAFGQPDPRAIQRATQLKWIHISSSGITRYDNPVFRASMAQRGIPVTNSAMVYSEACAVHALSFMLAQARTLPRSLTLRTPNGSEIWTGLRGDCRLLRQETVLIVGFGAIGRRLTALLQPFDMRVIACRRKPQGNEGAPVITIDQLPGMLPTADHVINVLPDSPDTRHYFDRERFAFFKPGAVFYNIGRGTTVDQHALVETLQSGKLAAAWLDVTEPEPLPDSHPLWREPNCHITPHIAGGHAGEVRTLIRHFLNNFGSFLRKETLRDRVM
jgi:phosphoglycerate dehydrogenase-like enzyme